MSNSLDLFDFFVQNYYEFDKCFNERYNVNDDVMLLFGISGAGKSTFLARLITDNNADDFMNSLPKKRNDFKIISDIKIGNSMASTTIIPKKYNVKNYSIYDMPGLKDNDKTRKITINILHKCLLTRLTKYSFLIIININALEERKLTQIIDDYHGELYSLFGEDQYKKNIKNFFFVLTHNDKYKYNQEEITNLLMEVTNYSNDIEDNPHLPAFLHRLSRFNIVVNYDEDTSDILIQKLTRLTNNKEDIQSTNLNIKKFEVYSDTLNLTCQSEIGIILNTYNKEYNSVIESYSEKFISLNNHLNGYNNNKTVILTIKQEIVKLNNNIKAINDTNNINEKIISDLKVINDEISREMNIIKRQIEDEKNVLNKLYVVKLRTDCSYKYLMSNYVKTVVNKSNLNIVDDLILITTYDNSNELISKYLQLENSIIPINLEQLKHYDNPCVLYNGSTKKKIPNYEPVIKGLSKDDFEIEMTYKEPFKIHYYHVVKFIETVEYKTITNFYHSQCKQLESNVKNNNDKINNSKSEIVINKKMAIKTESDLNELSEKLESTIKVKEQILKQLNETVNNLIVYLNHNVTRLNNDFFDNKKTQRIIEINSIFVNNNLNTKLNDIIEDVNRQKLSLQSMRNEKITKLNIIQREVEIDDQTFAEQLNAINN